MEYNQKIHHRRSIRLKGYDYSQAGLYFITICCQNRICLFGKTNDGEMILNDAGYAAKKYWYEIPMHYPHIRLHEFVIMPNHVHGIVGAENIPPLRENIPPLGNIVRGYKIGVTKWFQKNKNYQIGTKIWQRNYWEHIIRNENEYRRITQYIINNPKKWEQDKLNGGSGNQVMESSAPYGQHIFCPYEEEWMI